ncbi:oxaloacetate decarboxylase subunit gamma [Glaesserella sp.]|uniref:oxaloacetate decarboxylase subunit gamma n=1 Tax=Glaesserella sp. TaxID=2094731 RepID=UPI00359FBE20
MTKTDLIIEGINLMFIGMGFVMLFLFLLIIAITFISNTINRYFPEQTRVTVVPSTVSPTPTSASDDVADLRPIIIAAIAHHRRKHGLNK